jgi:hypothetical protein
MIAYYERSGIRFAYPENWTIADEQLDESPLGVSVQSPQGGYWDLRIFSSRLALQQVSDQALDAMREEYADLETEAVTEELFNVTAVGYDLDFFCLDLLVTSRIRSFHLGDRTLLLICQAENREFDRQQLVYSAITKSLLEE